MCDVAPQRDPLVRLDRLTGGSFALPGVVTGSSPQGAKVNKRMTRFPRPQDESLAA